MADLDLKPLFKFPETVGTLISFLETSRKALKTGQVEPVRHFLEVRLQDKVDREHLLSVMSKLIVVLRMGRGETLSGDHDKFGSMPVGYIPAKFKGKVVLRQVIEPSKAFTDKVKTELRTKNVPVKVHKEYVAKEISLEQHSIPPSHLKDFSRSLSLARILIRASLEELAFSDDWSSDLPTNLNSSDGKNQVDVSYLELLEEFERITNYQVSEDQDGARFALESADSVHSLSLGLLVRVLPKLILRLEGGPHAEKYPKLLRALKAVWKLVEIIRSDK